MKFKTYIIHLNELFTLKKTRLYIASEALMSSLEHAGLKPLTKEQWAAVDKVWGKYKGQYDPRWFELYHFIHPDIGNDIAWIIPLDYWLTYVDSQLVNPDSARALDDKNLYNLLCPDIKQPRTICRFIDGICQDADYHIIDFATCLESCKATGKVIVKPATSSCGGRGIFVWDASTDSADQLREVLESGKNYVVQELVQQHPVMSMSNESSCNTIRIMTLVVDGKVHVFPRAYTRLGGKGCVIDNITSGGYYAGVDPDGRIGSLCRDHWQRVTQLDFGDRVVPNYQKCLDLVANAAPRLADSSKIISWDLAIDQQGDPVLIELNLGRTDFQSFQCLFGPYFKEFIPFFQRVAKPKYINNNILIRTLDKIISKRVLNIKAPKAQ